MPHKTKVFTDISTQLEEKHVLQFEQFLGELLRWNRAYNLTAIDDPLEIYEKHFADSAVPLKFIQDSARVVDIGTGAGFPGIPIKILREDVEVVLVESISKKANFCDHVIRELKLKNIKIIPGRIEDKAVIKKAGPADVVISRATLKLPKLVKMATPYLKEDGDLIAMMGSSWKEDLDASVADIKKTPLKLVNIHEYQLPITRARRALLIFTKI